jgi:hypothetical protein
MHSTDPEILKVPKPALRAFDKSVRLVLELVFSPTSESGMQQAMLLGEGQTLTDVIGPSLFSRLVARTSIYGLPVDYVNRLKPWAAGLALSLPLAELKRAAKGALALDRALQNTADTRGIPVYGLETMEEQVAVFDRIPEDDQIDALRRTIELNPEIDAQFDEMKDAYLEGDLDKLHAMAARMYSGSDSELADLFETRFIDLRNRRMANRLARHVKKGGAFVAIGALHLSGDKGVLHLLELRGYTVKRVE